MDFNENDDFIKQLQKKKKKSLLKKSTIKDTLVDINKEERHGVNKEGLDTNKEEKLDTGIKVEQNETWEEKDLPLESFHNTFAKKKNRFAILKHLHSEYGQQPENLNEYEASEKVSTAKRTFDYSENNLARKKPKVVDVSLDSSFQENIVDKANVKIENDLKAKQLKKMKKTEKSNPDFYFGVSQTLNFFSNSEVNKNLTNPILSEKIEMVSTEVPANVLEDIFNSLNTAAILRQEENSI
ncbi:hypothetical protein QEN19_003586 [Hanseniaspora menglaensis]